MKASGPKKRQLNSPFEYAQIAFSPDAQYLLCGGCRREGVVSIHDLIKQRWTSDFELKSSLPGDMYGITDMACAPDGERVVMAIDGATAERGAILVWDWKTRKEIYALPAHRYGKALCVAFSRDGRWLASSGQDYRVKLWEPASGKKGASFRAKHQCVDSVSFSPDSAKIAWGTEGGSVAVVDLHTRTEIYCFRAHRADVRAVCFSPCGELLATGCQDGSIKVLEAQTGKETLILDGERVFSLAFSPHGLLVSSGDSCVLVWDLKKRKRVNALPADRNWCGPVRFSPDGKTLALGGYTLCLWDADAIRTARDVKPSCLKGKVGTVSLPTDLRTGLQKAAASVRKPGPKVRGMPPPEHLASCTTRIQSKCSAKRCTGKVQCPCGNAKVHLFYAGRIYAKERIADAGSPKFVLIVKSVCPRCGAEHLLFDKHLHGWNGFVCREAAEHKPSLRFAPWRCPACDQPENWVVISLAGEGKQDALSESGGELDENNWQEGFGWIDASIECCNCRHKIPGWLNEETM